MAALTAVDNEFDALGARLHLSILCNLHEMCYCLLNLDKRCYVALRVVPFHIGVVDYNDLHRAVQRILSHEALLNIPLQSVRCIYASRSAMLIPNELYDPTALKHFLEFSVPLNELDEVHSLTVPSAEAQVVFAVPSPMADLLSRKFNGNVDFFHQCIPMLSAASAQLPSDTLIAVNVHRDFADIALFVRKKLQLYNTFSLQSSHDLLYFLLAIARQYDLLPSSVNVVLAGDVGDCAPTLAAHFHNLIQAKPRTSMAFASALQPYAEHQFVNLFSLYECA